MKTKICTKCGKELPLTVEYFSKRPKGSNDGFRNECKECKNKYNKQYMKENKDNIAKYRKVYNEKNKEIIAEKKKQYYKENKVELAEKQKIRYQENKETIAMYYQKNKDKILEQKKKYNQENKEIVAARKKKWYEKNKDHFNKQHKIWREKNKEHNAKRNEIWRGKHKEELSEYCKEWRKANLETVRMYVHKRQALEKSLPFTLTTKQWENIKTHFNNTCCYCGKSLPLEQEHFIPVTKFGEYTHNNIIPACKSCNSSKHNKDFFEWYPKYKYYSKKREKLLLDYLGYNKDVQQLKII